MRWAVLCACLPALALADDAGTPVRPSTSSHCRAVDLFGAVAAELTIEGSSIKCLGRLREKLKERCAGKPLQFTFIGELKGVERKPVPLEVACPPPK